MTSQTFPSNGKKRTIDIRDPLYGYILINELEKEIIDSRPVQRLHHIRQLAGAYLVYPGADHMRFGHSLGVMHLAGVQLKCIQEKIGEVDESLFSMIRLAGVLHDIGHGPFSHTYESILQKNRKATHEDLTEWLIKTSEIGDILDKHGISKNEMALLARGHLPSNVPKWVPQIISGPWDVDKMDFLRRDSHYTGAEYGLIDVFRIIFSTNVINDTLMLDSTALYALEALLIARYEMFKAVYYHKTVRAAELMLVSAMELANSELELTAFETPNQFLELDDGYVFTGLRRLKGAKDPELKAAYQISEKFHARKLLKLAGEKILHVPDKFTAALYTKPSVKKDLEYEIANAAGVDPENVFIDIPTLPSIPYNPRALDPQDLPLFHVENHKRVPISADRISNLITVLRGFMDVIRCFTWDAYRTEVGKAAAEVFGAFPQSANISF